MRHINSSVAIRPGRLPADQPLRFYSETNIGSRPASGDDFRGSPEEGLRAIPFAGSRGQLKQNVTGCYGVGSALRQLEKGPVSSTAEAVPEFPGSGRCWTICR